MDRITWPTDYRECRDCGDILVNEDRCQACIALLEPCS